MAWLKPHPFKPDLDQSFSRDGKAIGFEDEIGRDGGDGDFAECADDERAQALLSQVAKVGAQVDSCEGEEVCGWGRRKEVLVRGVTQDGTHLCYRTGYKFPVANGVTSMPGYNVLQGANMTENMGLFRRPMHNPIVFLNAFYYVVGDGVLRYFLTGDKNFDALTFDVKGGRGSGGTVVEQSIRRRQQCGPFSV